MKIMTFVLAPLLLFSTRISDNIRHAGETVEVNGLPGKIVPGKRTPEIQEIPVLCYHNIHDSLGHHNPLTTISTTLFRAQMKCLFDSGFHTITPDQLRLLFQKRQPLPQKAVLITFDDGHEEDYSIAASILEQYHFTGVFFVFTVALNKKHYLTDEQIRELAFRGHTIGAHTWDHPHLSAGGEWNGRRQLYSPKQTLERISGKPVDYFAYPLGEWSPSVIDSLKTYGYKGAFQLSGRKSNNEPLYTIRRMMVSGKWQPEMLQRMMKNVFK